VTGDVKRKAYLEEKEACTATARSKRERAESAGGSWRRPEKLKDERRGGVSKWELCMMRTGQRSAWFQKAQGSQKEEGRFGSGHVYKSFTPTLLPDLERGLMGSVATLSVITTVCGGGRAGLRDGQGGLRTCKDVENETETSLARNLKRRELAAVLLTIAASLYTPDLVI
jgi:hypothetical protein